MKNLITYEDALRFIKKKIYMLTFIRALKHCSQPQTRNKLGQIYLVYVPTVGSWFLIPSSRVESYILGHEKKIIDHLRSIFKIRKIRTFIDIGAYIGYYTIFAGKFVNKVLAFEPDPRNFLLLKQNILINNVRNAYIFNLAIFSHDGYVPFRLSDVSSMSSIISYRNDVQKCIDIRCMKLDTILETRTNNVDLIKIDVEGAGFEVIKGGIRTIRKHKPLILFEIHLNSSKDELKAMRVLIDKYCYKIGMIFIRAKENFIAYLEPVN